MTPNTHTRVPPLRNGDRMSREEFERRYTAMPHLRKAELIDGVVYVDHAGNNPTEGKMGSPVTFDYHAMPHFDLIGWLWYYRSFTPGLKGGDNATWRPPSVRHEPQPDGLLRIRAECGGQSHVTDDHYLAGAPELVAEVSYSSVSYDSTVKFDAYRDAGVREYVIWRTDEAELDWYTLRNGQYEPIRPGADGILRSEVFPGLWLDAAALLGGDMTAVIGAVQRGLASPEHAAFAAELQRRLSGG